MHYLYIEAQKQVKIYFKYNPKLQQSNSRNYSSLMLIRNSNLTSKPTAISNNPKQTLKEGKVKGI